MIANQRSSRTSSSMCRRRRCNTCHSRRLPPAIVLLGALGLLYNGLSACHAVDLKSYIYGSSSSDDGADGEGAASRSRRPVRLPRVVSRDVETSVAAADWPTTILSPLCEAWAFLDAGDGNDDGSGGDGNAENGGLTWRYLDALTANADGAMPSSYDEAIEMAVRSVALGPSAAGGDDDNNNNIIAKSFDESFQGRLLRYNLALRTYSPLCELHRTLARDTAIGSGLYRPMSLDGIETTTASLPNAFAVLYPAGTVATDAEQLVEAYLGQQRDDVRAAPDGDGDESPLLPGERTRIGDSRTHLVILYGQMGTSKFRHFYKLLSVNNVPFVVRSMGAVDFEEAGVDIGAGQEGVVGLTGLTATKTTLQGYGVRLDIRNLEYKVFDDKADASGNADDDTEDDEDAEGGGGGPTAIRPEFLAGFNLTKLVERSSSSDDVINAEDNATRQILSVIQHKLIESDHVQSFKGQTVPPQWQRRDLPLQAAHVVSSASDPLWALQDVSQNLPSHASTLVEVAVPDEVRIAAELATEIPVVASARGDQGPFALLVNGRRIAVQRPSFNLFELMNILREENALLVDLEKSLGNHLGPKGLAAVQNMIEMGETALDTAGSKNGSSKKTESDLMDDPIFGEDEDDDEEDNGSGGTTFRIDVGRGYRGAVTYINDIERDPQYRQWPRSIEQMLMMAQFGQAPTVRRNMFTMLLVVDPLSGNESRTLDMAIQLIQANLPIRLGFLFVSETDIDSCKAAVSSNGSGDGDDSCFFPPLDIGDAVDLSDVKGITATTKAASLLVENLVQKHGGMASLGFVDMMLSTWKGKSSLKDLIEIYVDFLRRSQLIGTSSGAVEDALVVLGNDTRRDPDDMKSTYVDYAMAVEFAVNKSIRPGMSFLNGLPLPDSPQDMQRTFFEEQNNVMQLAMSGAITDTKPKSIYGMLLTGDNVHARHHPLLMESKGRYFNVDHGFGHESLRSPTSHDPKAVSLIGSKEEKSPAPFVVEAFVDLESKEGQLMVIDFIESMEALSSHLGGDSISAVYRIIPIASSSDEGPLVTKVMAQARQLEASVLKAFVAACLGKNGSEIESILSSIPDLSNEGRDTIQKALAADDGAIQTPKVPKEILPAANFILANGRIFVPDGTVSSGDIEILLSMSLTRSRAVARLMQDELKDNDRPHDAVAKASAFVGTQFSLSRSTKRMDVSSLDAQKDPTRALYFQWNHDNKEHLQVKVTAILDPLSEATQRVSPLLRAIRDQLKLPLSLMLAPRPVIGGEDLPVSSYYRFVADPQASADRMLPKASFQNLPTNHVLTIRMDVPEPWNVQQNYAVQDTDNLRCDVKSGCSDESYSAGLGRKSGDVASSDAASDSRIGRTVIEYGLRSLLFFGQCYDVSEGSPPNGLQLTIDQASQTNLQLLSASGDIDDVAEVEVQADGTVIQSEGTASGTTVPVDTYHTDTLVMKTVGYWQLRAKPGVFNLAIQKSSRGADIYEMVEGKVTGSGRVKVEEDSSATASRNIVMKDFVSVSEVLLVRRREGYEHAELYSEHDGDAEDSANDDTVHVFSLATGHLYERFLKIMMLSVTKRTSAKVKFWLFENFLSPSFKATATAMAKKIGCEVAFVTYKWPEWLRAQSEKQRIIWGYKILFLDVLFPLDVKKVIYVDADQVVRGDMKELVDLDLQGAPYGYTPMCSSREETRGYAFWNQGFWASHLRDRPYHISALYVVDLARFRREMVGDKLRSYYQSLTADPHSLANLDQDLPNYAQHDIPIKSLPQEWLWCESWCSDETKATAKTIDLCNNPMHKEPKVSMAKRIISGELFEESWVELDEEVQAHEDEYFASLGHDF